MTTDKTPATLAVDVLAVMDAMSAWARLRVDPDWTVKTDDARAAVAELIEAVEAERKGDYFDSEVELWSEFSIRRRRQKERVSSALARVKGESA
ncbi:hypothetical protein H3005_20040 [Stenotrophomonas sp. Br8]|uniref:hypothetical protein n=1 Tax=Stenotrophomonas sp. Br8 TaxID=2759658 RepID=UPI00168ADAC5|nr:hypothetical protein [Stenotrophomonas sp. Br8]MBD3684147.1 hypothetical protein [Stenotrophomonas sp. Br8]